MSDVMTCETEGCQRSVSDFDGGRCGECVVLFEYSQSLTDEERRDMRTPADPEDCVDMGLTAFENRDCEGH